MKKLLITVFSFLYISSASADVGFNVGASAQMGLFSASAKEFSGTINKDNGSEHGEAAWGSIFLEGTINDRFILGIDYVPSSLETETAETAKSDMGKGAQANTIVTNKIQVDFEDLTTLYAGIMITENMYVKAGITSVDVITNENLGTGAAYPNAELDGSMFGVGYHNALDNGIFFRLEGNYMTFDGATLTSNGNDSSDSKIQLKSLDGVSGKISVGKSF
jgi:hypothetical protein